MFDGVEGLLGAGSHGGVAPGQLGRSPGQQATEPAGVIACGARHGQHMGSETAVGARVRTVQRASNRIDRVGAVVVEDPEEQGVLVAEGAIQAPLA